MNLLRTLILSAAGRQDLRDLLVDAPITQGVINRFVAGDNTEAAVATTSALASSGLAVTLDYLGEDTTDRELAERTVQAYLRLLDQLHEVGLAKNAEVSVKLSAVGLALDERMALDNAFRICAAAEQCGTTVTVDMEDHGTTDSTLHTISELRQTWPWVGAVLQAYLYRTMDDCAALATEGSRVRLCKGAYAEPGSVAFTDPHEIAVNYVRCANVLLAGQGYPMFATHDSRIIDILRERVRWYGRSPDSYEYQFLYGIRPETQRDLSAEGKTVRVYVPYGEQWYGYLMRRLAERPANLALFLRALTSRG